MGALSTFPVSTIVAGRRVVVVGGAEAAHAKLRLLARTRASITVFAREFDNDVRRLAEAHGYELVARLPDRRDFAGAALAFIATEDEAVDIGLAGEARAAHVPVNVVDRPEHCDVLTPAIVDRAPVTVAISTEGAAPVLAGILRGRIEALLPPGLGELAGVAGSLRERVAALLPPGSRRLTFWRAYFAGERLAEAATRGEHAVRRAALRLLEAVRSRDAEPGMVWLVGAGPGAADLITLRGKRILEAADVVVHDRLVDADVMEHVRRDARRIDVGKRKGHAAATQEEINRILVEEAGAGHRVVRLKAGDPMIYGRAGEEIAALRAAGIAHSVVPGITAALGAAAETTTPVTHRRHASTLVFATGHAAPGEDDVDWSAVARRDATVTLYMAKSVADRIARSLLGAGLAPETPVGAVENATRPDARRFFGRLDALPALARRDDIDGPVVIFIGHAVAEGDWADAEAFAATAELAA